MCAARLSDDEIVALTLTNRRVAADLLNLLNEGTLYAYLAGILEDHEGKLSKAWEKLQPMAPLALPLTYDQWTKAIHQLYANTYIIDDLDSSLQYMEAGGRTKERAVVSARADWEHLVDDSMDGNATEAYIRTKFDSWPEPVKQKILALGSLDERLAAIKKSEAFESALRAAAGIGTGIPR